MMARMECGCRGLVWWMEDTVVDSALRRSAGAMCDGGWAMVWALGLNSRMFECSKFPLVAGVGKVKEGSGGLVLSRPTLAGILRYR